MIRVAAKVSKTVFHEVEIEVEDQEQLNPEDLLRLATEEVDADGGTSSETALELVEWDTLSPDPVVVYD